jgi:hypothetical protein
MTLIIFLSENGYYLHYNDQSELVRYALRVAKHKQVQVTTIRDWIKKRARKTPNITEQNRRKWAIVEGFKYLTEKVFKEKETHEP